MTGLCLVLSAAPVAAQELKPVLTLKIAAPGDLLQIAEKFAGMTGTTETLRDAVAPLEELKGFNTQGPFGLVLHSNGTEIKEPVLVLPIENPDAMPRDAEMLMPINMLRTQMKKRGEGEYLFNSPVGPYAVKQIKGFLVIAQEDSKVALPDDPAELVADLKDYTIGLRLDLENTDLDSIRAFLAPIQMMAALGGGLQVSEAMETLNEQLELLYNEVASATLGVAVDPKTAAVTLAADVKPRKGSDSEKQLLKVKDAQTIFAGFRGGPDAVIACNGVDYITEASAQTGRDTLDAALDGFLEQIVEQAETDENVEFAEAVAESFRKVVQSLLVEGYSDVAFSLEADGLCLGAMTLGDTADLEKFASQLVAWAEQHHDNAEIEEFLKKHHKKNYETIEGFQLSRLTIPLTELAAEAHEIPEAWRNTTLFCHYGVQAGKAVALAVGSDEAKTANAFKTALTATRTPKPVEQPVFSMSLRSLGLFLKPFESLVDDESYSNFVASLAAAPPDARITATSSIVGDRTQGNITVDGHVVSILIDVFGKILAENASSEDQLDRSGVREL